mmetsp:Transcript_32483/g.71723  ORF Transcript_32483/g.71723 Transcript_32483/m.71723 type:complete len:240 (+) Transcript_32483:118-837(+)|eukprot:CAMPEP_0202900716 /NCGR_PEP_ID=MMETSP1392-20130828/11999_1 /ASSEMBLY_ACC=CAM_ASM_000868 /TAXON_ID=225041 /ORGANISM="Chlamydomonas chlamydogama, Strain SAG 11-48b" /LENGTH=239 /DNA_ID=CAMNT_0049587157 /DNA_START=116 /DNA_END=835 /DNA_ORIENTATION=-
MADTTATAKPEEAKAPAANPFAALGSTGATFGTGAGFGFGVGAFTATAPAAKTGDEDGAEGEDDGAAPEEECQAEFKPVVQLEEVETSTGEEDEDALVDLKAKLYRFDQGNNEWKERGVGQVKLLQHKENKKVRLLMRQDKTLKIRANHLVMPTYKLQEHAGNDKAWVWSAVDFADGEQKLELFCIRFGSPEKAQEFKGKFEEAKDINAKLITDAPAHSDETAKEADKVADEVAEKAAV